MAEIVAENYEIKARIEMARLPIMYLQCTLNTANSKYDGTYERFNKIIEREGSSWKWRRVIEDVGKGNGAVTYPTVIQAKNGLLCCTYQYKTKDRMESIKYLRFDEAWIRAGGKLK